MHVGAPNNLHTVCFSCLVSTVIFQSKQFKINQWQLNVTSFESGFDAFVCYVFGKWLVWSSNSCFLISKTTLTIKWIEISVMSSDPYEALSTAWKTWN